LQHALQAADAAKRQAQAAEAAEANAAAGAVQARASLARLEAAAKILAGEAGGGHSRVMAESNPVTFRTKRLKAGSQELGSEDMANAAARDFSTSALGGAYDGVHTTRATRRHYHGSVTPDLVEVQHAPSPAGFAVLAPSGASQSIDNAISHMHGSVGDR
jgi:hypothetical protein